MNAVQVFQVAVRTKPNMEECNADEMKELITCLLKRDPYMEIIHIEHRITVRKVDK